MANQLHQSCAGPSRTHGPRARACSLSSRMASISFDSVAGKEEGVCELIRNDTRAFRFQYELSTARHCSGAGPAFASPRAARPRCTRRFTARCALSDGPEAMNATARQAR